MTLWLTTISFLKSSRYLEKEIQMKMEINFRTNRSQYHTYSAYGLRFFYHFYHIPHQVCTKKCFDHSRIRYQIWKSSILLQQSTTQFETTADFWLSFNLLFRCILCVDAQDNPNHTITIRLTVLFEIDSNKCVEYNRLR